MTPSFSRTLCRRLLPVLGGLALTAFAREPAPLPSPSVARLDGDNSRLVNIATRASTGPGSGALIAGFVITGPGSKTVLVRGVGPSLAAFGLSNLLPDPGITLIDGAGRPVAANDNFDPAITPAGLVPGVGAFSLTHVNDAALVATLAPGSYTVVVADTNNRPGLALVEVYEIGTTPGRISSLSSRALVGAGPATAIAGFAVLGEKPRKFLIRGIGPTLTGFGVTGALADPILALTTANGVLIASSDDWGSGGNPAEIVAASAAVGAFVLPGRSRDAALVVTLNPGNYTALLGGTNNTGGVALVEVYEVP